jgi:hypothetical protein
MQNLWKSFNKFWAPLSKGRKVLYSVGAVFVFLFLLGMISPTEEQSTSTPTLPSSVNTDETTTSSNAALTPKQKLTKLINESAGDDSSLDGINVRVKSLDIADDQVLIDLYGDENLTEGLLKSSNRRLVLDAIDAYQSSGLIADQVSISVWFPLVDEAGVETLRRVLSYGFSAAQIARIQTENIDTKNMDNGMADTYTAIYPAFRW